MEAERIPVALKRMTISGGIRNAGDPVPEVLGSKNLKTLMDTNFICWPEEFEGRLHGRTEPRHMSHIMPVAKPEPVVAPAPAETSPVDAETATASAPVGGHTCDECGNEFASERGLKTHVRRMHD